MILGGVLSEKAGLDFEYKSGFILFPLLVHTLDLIVSTIGILFVKTKPGLPSLKPDYGSLEDPLDILKRGYYARRMQLVHLLLIHTVIFVDNLSHN